MGRSNLLKMVLSIIYRKHEATIAEIKKAVCEDAAVDKLTKGVKRTTRTTRTTRTARRTTKRRTRARPTHVAPPSIPASERRPREKSLRVQLRNLDFSVQKRILKMFLLIFTEHPDELHNLPQASRSGPFH